MTLSVLALPPLLALAFCAGCASSPPPFTHPASAYTPPPANEANLVLLWPETSCDRAGHVTVAISDGRFVANVGRGTQVWAHVPAGNTSLLTWNDTVEQMTGVLHREAVAPLHADLVAGRTYYVLVAYGEWDDRGPRERWVANRRVAWRACTTTLALLSVVPGSPQWGELAGWVEALTPLQPEPAGQAWLDANREALETHAAIAEARFASLRPDASRLATIAPDDGAP